MKSKKIRKFSKNKVKGNQNEPKKVEITAQNEDKLLSLIAEIIVNIIMVDD